MYSKYHCRQCTYTKNRLTRLGVPFTEVNVEDDDNALLFIKQLGYLAAPVVYVNKKIHWSGFRPDDIDKLRELL